MTNRRYISPNHVGSTKKGGSTQFSDEYRFNTEKLYGYFNVVNRHWCEVSRTENLQRGIGLFIGFIGLIATLMTAVVTILTFSFDPLFESFFGIMFCVLCSVVYLLFKIDLCTPADQPVRFNRLTQKVYVYHYHWHWNPFKKWYVEVKSYDWADISADITGQSGPVGYGYVSRVALICTVYKPGTNEVMERFPLVSNQLPGMASELSELWRYCWVFMNEPTLYLPRPTLRGSEPTLNNSLKHYLPLLMYGEPGKQALRDMNGAQWFIGIFGILILPVSLPITLCHYIVMRKAAKVKWPEAIDRESRTNKIVQSGDVQERQ